LVPVFSIEQILIGLLEMKFEDPVTVLVCIANVDLLTTVTSD